MPSLDHINIQTKHLTESVAFYRDVIGLEARDLPGFDSALVQWMHDERGNPILHLGAMDSLFGEAVAPARADTGALHHVALECTGHDAMVALLEAKGLSYRSNHVPAIDLRQIFVRDPNGVLLELNYRAA